MEETFTVTNDFSETISAYVSREAGKGKEPVRILRRLMSYWLLNALKRTDRADAAGIVSELMTKTRIRGSRKKRKSKLYEDMRDTLAVLYVLKTNYKGAKTAKEADLYKIAKRFVASRKFSSGLHRAGFVPALRSLRTSAGERLPRYKNEPGEMAKQTETVDGVSIEATNFAKIIAEIAPNAFEDGGAELAQRLSGYLLQDMLDAQRAAGLLVK